ncbi:uncharacterized protein LOC128680471 isoform X2 [Plodia interpunctella]|uniref:uncharacterized protein LOC128680471 isoform X2 n=1 Tax=Plodia interpunctella TaxID=58824 RepID=UPI002367DA78|nr:uncharacterized protein LOC128680471 isoform X2 [Plodia interpunctella]
MFHLSKQLFSVLCAYQGSILIGYTMGWTAPIIPKLQDPEQTPLPDIPTDGQISWIGSLLYIGCIIGPYSLGPLSNVKGRKPCFLISGCIIIVSFILLGAAQNLAMIYAGRVLIGVGLGIISVINVVYIGEVASTNIRGILLSGTGIFSTLGTLIMYAIGPYVSYVMSTVIGIALTLLYLIGLYFIPETPLFNVMKDVAHNPIADKLGWLPLLSLVVFFLSYDLGFGIIPSALTGEMFEPNVRSLGSAVTSTVAWSIGFGVSTGFGYMLSAWGGHVTFWVYSGACAFATLFSVLFVPETRGKSLLEIQTMLNM